MKLSILIPAYNAGLYIEDCLESLLNQKLREEDYEVLLIDDASTDNTLAIAKSVCGKKSNFHFLSNDLNRGNGAARNVAIDNAKGDYIYFMDADDYVAQNSLHHVLRLAKTNGLDLLFFSMRHVRDSSIKTSKDDFHQKKPQLTVSDGITFIGQRPYRDEVWSYFINRNFFQKSAVRYYDERKFSQDQYITSKLLTLAKKVGHIDYDVYRYRKTPNSIVNKKSREHLKMHLESLDTAIEKCHALRQILVENGIENKAALLRLRVKQQRYITILIMRFIQSDLPYSYLKKQLQKFKSMGIYPMDSLYKISDFIIPRYRTINTIFNRPYLLRPLILLYRFYKSALRPFKKF